MGQKRPKAEMLSEPKAIVAMEEEWLKLRDCPYRDLETGEMKKGVWDDSAVEEFSNVEARVRAEKNFDEWKLDEHFGRLFDICAEKRV